MASQPSLATAVLLKPPKEGGKGDTSEQPLANGPWPMLSFRQCPGLAGGVPGHSSAQGHAQYPGLVGSVVQL